MRLWTVHPKHLDAKGLVALWREGLLAQKVIRGMTRGYRQHPQLTRFLSAPKPVDAIASYLWAVHGESQRRGYSFDCSKITGSRTCEPIRETIGQLLYEWSHLAAKLATRDPERHRHHRKMLRPDAHPLFRIVRGHVRPWEKIPRTPRKAPDLV